jgi:formylmethanofuran dehydrogenase subunit E
MSTQPPQLTPAQHWQRVQKLIADATAAGTHGPGIGHVCQSCREWVRAFYHRELDGRMICEACWRKQQPGVQEALEAK